MRLVKIVLVILAFLGVGALGFLIGSVGGAAVGIASGGIGGALMGVCEAADVAVAEGLITPEEQATLVDATAARLRADYAELLRDIEVEPELRLTAQNCPGIVERLRPQPS